ncbi:hypothetical protein LZ554_009237 [Drepanopeziza brunnea f. sp. 'monogermtubi']|nr:hypothetical protein LZ554_009237 [Drepanopeziza brunnea f. sp. 'monogermtubi']
MDPTHLQPGIFLHPRPRKPLLSSHPPNKRRKTEHHKVEEINFDDTSRADYLTGFHKRKVQRAKRAREEEAKKGREERVLMRRQLREERKQELEEHVSAINAALRAVGDPDVTSSDSDSDAWHGFSDDDEKATSKSKPKSRSKLKSNSLPAAPVLDHEEEYLSSDEDKHTTVTIEAVDVSKEGLHRIANADESGEDGSDSENRTKAWKTKEKEEAEAGGGGKKKWPKKERKPKFRYESKVERKATRMKQKGKNRASAEARKGGG